MKRYLVSLPDDVAAEVDRISTLYETSASGLIRSWVISVLDRRELDGQSFVGFFAEGGWGLAPRSASRRRK